MSFIYSRALVEESLRGLNSDIAAFVQLSGSHTLRPFSWHDRTIDRYPLSRFGMTSEPLTVDLGAELLTSWLADFPARLTAAHLEDALWLTISGRRCDGSWQMSLPGSSLPRTSADAQLTVRETTYTRWVTKSPAFPFPRQTWVRTTFGSDIGYLHTPTCAANYAAPSMQKHPSARAFVAVFGKPSPMSHEWLMDWPSGWTALWPLGTGRSEPLLRQLSESSPPNTLNAQAQAAAA